MTSRELLLVEKAVRYARKAHRTECNAIAIVNEALGQNNPIPPLPEWIAELEQIITHHNNLSINEK